MPKSNKYKKAKFLKSVPNYFKNVTKSVIYSSADALKEVAPSVADFTESNGELFSEIVSDIRDFKSIMKNVKEKINNSEVTKSTDDYVKNVFDDLKTGKFYNKDRQEKINMESYGFNFDDSFDMGLDDFSSSIDSSLSESTNVVTEVVEKATTACIKSNNDIIENSNEQSSTIITCNYKMFNDINNALSTMSSNLQGLFDYTKNITAYHEKGLKFYDDSKLKIDEIHSFLKQMNETNENLYKQKQSDYESNPMDDVLSYTGALKITDYFNNVKKNVKSEWQNSLVGSMAGMFGDDTNILKSVTGSPLSMISTALSKKLIGDNLSNSLESFDKTFGSFAKTAMMKLTSKARDNYDNPVLEMAARIFGMKYNSTDGVNPKEYNKGPVSYNGLANKSIVEVIPTYLRKILSAINGKSELLYDYSKGSFTNKSKLKERYDDDIDSTYSSMYRTKNLMKENLNSYHIEDENDRKQLDEDLNKFVKFLVDTGNFYNPFDKKDSTYDKMNEKGLFLNGGEESYNLLKSSILAMNKSDIMDINNNVYDTKTYRSNYMKELKNKSTEKGYDSLFNNSNVDDGVGKGIIGSGLNAVDKYKKSMLDYLRDISVILMQGIKTYSCDIHNHNRSDSRNKRNSYLKVLDNRLDEYNKEIDDLEEDSNKNDYTFDHKSDSSKDVKDLNDVKNMSMNELVTRMKDNKILKNKGNIFEKTDKLVSNIKDNKNVSSIDKLLNSINEIMDAPRNILSKTIDNVNTKLFSVLYGRQTISSDIDNIESQGVIELALDKLDKFTNTVSDFINNKIINPLSDKLFNEKNGIITKMNNKYGTKLKGYYNKSKDYLFGEKNEEGERLGGLMTGIYNNFVDMKNATHHFITGKEYVSKVDGKTVSEDLKNSLFGNFKTISSKFKGYVTDTLFGEKIETKDENGNITLKRNKDKGLLSNITNGFKNTINSVSTTLFGVNAGDNFKSFYDDKIKDHLPKTLASAGVGIVASAFLPGGPILGALLGATSGFVSSSENLKTKLFGEMGNDGKRVGSKFMSAKTQEMVKKYVPSTVGFGLLGKTLFSAFTPLGPIFSPLAGMLLGSGIGMAKKSESFKEFLFGKEVDGKRDNSGIINKELIGKMKKYLPGSLVGIGATALLKSKLGLLGSFLVPGGPIGTAVIGTSLGILGMSDKVKTYLFGEYDEEKQKREGGLFGRFKLFAKFNILEPMKLFAKESGVRLKYWFKENIGNPIKDAIEPAKVQFKIALDSLKNKVKSGVDSIVGRIGDMFEKRVGMPMQKFMQEKLLNPIKGVFNKIFGGITKFIGGIASAPFKLMTGVINGFVGEHERNGYEYVERYKKEKKQRKLKTAYEKNKELREIKNSKEKLKIIQNSANEGNYDVKNLETQFALDDYNDKYFDKKSKPKDLKSYSIYMDRQADITVDGFNKVKDTLNDTKDKVLDKFDKIKDSFNNSKNGILEKLSILIDIAKDKYNKTKDKLNDNLSNIKNKFGMNTNINLPKNDVLSDLNNKININNIRRFGSNFTNDVNLSNLKTKVNLSNNNREIKSKSTVDDMNNKDKSDNDDNSESNKRKPLKVKGFKFDVKKDKDDGIFKDNNEPKNVVDEVVDKNNKQKVNSKSNKTDNVKNIKQKVIDAEFEPVNNEPKNVVDNTLNNIKKTNINNDNNDVENEDKINDLLFYAKDTNKYVKLIYDELNGQLDGLGYNMERTALILEETFGPSKQKPTGKRTSIGNFMRKGFLGRIFNKLKTNIMKPIEFVKKKIFGAFNSIAKLVKKPFEILGKSIENISAAVPKVMGVIGDIGKFAFSIMSDVSAGLYQSLKVICNMGIQGIKVLGEGLTQSIKVVGNLLFHSAKGFGKFLGNMAHGIGIAIKDSISIIGQFGKSMMNIASEVIPKIAGFMVDTMTTVGKTIKNVVVGSLKGLYDLTLGKLFNKIGVTEKKYYVSGGVVDKVTVIDSISNINDSRLYSRLDTIISILSNGEVQTVDDYTNISTNNNVIDLDEKRKSFDKNDIVDAKFEELPDKNKPIDAKFEPIKNDSNTIDNILEKDTNNNLEKHKDSKNIEKIIEPKVEPVNNNVINEAVNKNTIDKKDANKVIVTSIDDDKFYSKLQHIVSNKADTDSKPDNNTIDLNKYRESKSVNIITDEEPQSKKQVVGLESNTVDNITKNKNKDNVTKFRPKKDVQFMQEQNKLKENEVKAKEVYAASIDTGISSKGTFGLLKKSFSKSGFIGKVFSMLIFGLPFIYKKLKGLKAKMASFVMDKLIKPLVKKTFEPIGKYVVKPILTGIGKLLAPIAKTILKLLPNNSVIRRALLDENGNFKNIFKRKKSVDDISKDNPKQLKSGKNTIDDISNKSLSKGIEIKRYDDTKIDKTKPVKFKKLPNKNSKTIDGLSNKKPTITKINKPKSKLKIKKGKGKKGLFSALSLLPSMSNKSTKAVTNKKLSSIVTNVPKQSLLSKIKDNVVDNISTNQNTDDNVINITGPTTICINGKAMTNVGGGSLSSNGISSNNKMGVVANTLAGIGAINGNNTDDSINLKDIATGMTENYVGDKVLKHGANAVTKNVSKNVALKSSNKVSESISKNIAKSENVAKSIDKIAKSESKNVIKNKTIDSLEKRVIKPKKPNKLVELVNKVFETPMLRKAFSKYKKAIPVIKKFIMKSFNKLTPNIIKEVTSKLTKKLAVLVGGGIASGGVITAALLGYDVINGVYATKQMLQLPPNIKPTMKMRIACSLSNLISENLTFGFADKHELAMLIYQTIADSKELKQLQQVHENMEKAVSEYNDKNGTDLTIDEYNEQVNKSGSGSLFNDTIKKVGGAVKNVTNKIKNSKFGQSVGKAVSAIGNEFQYVKNKASDIYSNVKGKVQNEYDYVKDKVKNEVDYIKNSKVGKAVGKTADAIGNEADYAKKKASEIGSSISGVFSQGSKMFKKIQGFGGNGPEDKKETPTPPSSNGNIINGLPYFSQGDSKWGGNDYSAPGETNNTIAKAGCGPTSAAMVVSGLLNKPITPAETAAWSKEHGFKVKNNGTSWDFFRAYGDSLGIPFKALGPERGQLRTALKAHTPTVLVGQGAPPFTRGGHFVVAAGLSPDENKVYINDPISKERSKAYSIETIMNGARQMFIPGKALGNVDPSTFVDGNLGSSSSSSSGGSSSSEDNSLMGMFSKIGKATNTMIDCVFKGETFDESKLEEQKQDNDHSTYGTKTSGGVTTGPLPNLSPTKFDFDVTKLKQVGTSKVGNPVYSGGKRNLGASNKEFIALMAKATEGNLERYGVPPSTTIAQAIGESGWGSAAIGNNLFGVKEGSSYRGPVINTKTSEYGANGKYSINDNFRGYTGIVDAIQSQVKNTIVDQPCYYKNVVNKDWEKSIEGLYPNYATNPDYVSFLKTLVKENNLTRFNKPAPVQAGGNGPDKPEPKPIVKNMNVKNRAGGNGPDKPEPKPIVKKIKNIDIFKNRAGGNGPDKPEEPSNTKLDIPVYKKSSISDFLVNGYKKISSVINNKLYESKVINENKNVDNEILAKILFAVEKIVDNTDSIKNDTTEINKKETTVNVQQKETCIKQNDNDKTPNNTIVSNNNPFTNLINKNSQNNKIKDGYMTARKIAYGVK